MDKHYRVGTTRGEILHRFRQTDWYVITGAPCSGKTAVIRELERRGEPVVHEVARAYIDAQQAEGRTLAQIRADVLDFEHRILAEKLAIEAAMPVDRRVFFDRGVPDSIAYFKAAGLDPRIPFEKSRIYRYRRVFFMQRLPFATDAVRKESERQAACLDRLLAACYQNLGYAVVTIPRMSVARRTDRVIGAL